MYQNFHFQMTIFSIKVDLRKKITEKGAFKKKKSKNKIAYQPSHFFNM